jgi:hypothetical protein
MLITKMKSQIEKKTTTKKNPIMIHKDLIKRQF